MTRAVAFAALAVWAACASASASETRLLSIVAPLRPGPGGDYVASFDIATWDVVVLAVCHFPEGWMLTAGQGLDPGGRLSGRAGGGAAALGAATLDRLRSLFLVAVDDISFAPTGDCRSACRPATFAGTAEIGRYGQDTRMRRLRLGPANLVLAPATRCP